MRGCARGGTSSNLQLAYTGEPISTVPNPYLAYTGQKGGASCGVSNPPPVPLNTNASNPLLPNTGAPATGEITFNNASQQFGGCGGAMCGIVQTGGKGCGCSLPFLGGNQKGGGDMSYPNGLVGKPWNIENIGRVGGEPNYYALNTLSNGDVSREMMANTAFVQRGGKKKRSKHNRHKKNKHTQKRKGQRGGTLSNFLTQDLINLGRQFQFGVGSAYNALAGYPGPVSPLPWKNQFGR